ncbi:MAG TPA: hypothetical protein VHO70_24855 [Chitinispirillaceae bacterium]|nr:hypothetical protein [Chitinispirillaceae bacterium]
MKFNKCSIYPLLMTILFSIQSFSSQTCTFYLDQCPENYNNAKLYVPSYVSKIDPLFTTCTPSVSVEDTQVVDTPPSIMFVIDNSNSMLGHDDDVPKDLDGSRFLVTKALIDSLAKSFPKAEVGLIVFRNQLVFETKDDSIFTTVPGSSAERGYIPLLKLDSTLSNGMTGAEYLKMRLETKQIAVVSDDGDTLTATSLAYDKSLTGGTNINASFDAARDAMAHAANPRDRQFVIFLSDGEATAPNNNKTAYVIGENMPTTFTIFFTPGATGNAPANIVTMTNNIKANGYSATNPQSDLWTIQTNFDRLMNLMMESIIKPIIVTVKRTPSQLVINKKTYTVSADSHSTFLLTDDIFLKDGTNHFDITISYKPQSDTQVTLKDTSINISFDVIRTDSVEKSQGLSLNCHDTIYYTVSVRAKDPDAAEKNQNSGIFEFIRQYSKGKLTVYYAIDGTATSSIDYSKIADSVIFPDGQSAVTVEINPAVDTLKEDNETVIITLRNNYPGHEILYNVGTAVTATVTIRDDYQVTDSVLLAVTPNPFQLNTPLNQKIKELFGSEMLNNTANGAFITVYSKIKLEFNSGTNSYGTGILYDAVGNIVKKITLSMGKNQTITGLNLYGAVWDGTNMKNRNAGQGTYLLKLKTRNTSGVEQVFTAKIGIKE